jgi:pyruvate dehydrogenase (quinone)
MSQSVAEALVDVLERVGVKQVFGLIGDSLNPLGDAIRRSSIEWIVSVVRVFETASGLN